SRERGGAERQPVGARADLAHPLGVAREHLDVREQVVRERDRLRDLQVREAGQDGLGVLRCELDERALHVAEQHADRLDLLAQPQPHVGRDLVVARAAGVQLLTGVAGELDQARLDVEVDVLEIDPPLERLLLDLFGDLRHAAADRGEVGCGDDAAVGEHRRVREAALDVGAPEALVERDAGRVTLHELARRLRKARRPGLGFLLELVRGHEKPGVSGLPERAHRTDCGRPGRRSTPRRGTAWRQSRNVQPQDVRDSIGGVSPPMSFDMAAPAPGGTTPRTTGFGNTVFDVVVPAQAAHRGPESAFDVCHVGVVLRALVFVHGVMAIGMVFGATGFASWTTLTAAGASVALPAVLLWLLVVCGLKAQLARAPLTAQWATVVALGAVSAFGASRLIALLLPEVPGGSG